MVSFAHFLNESLTHARKYTYIYDPKRSGQRFIKISQSMLKSQKKFLKGGHTSPPSCSKDVNLTLIKAKIEKTLKTNCFPTSNNGFSIILKLRPNTTKTRHFWSTNKLWDFLKILYEIVNKVIAKIKHLPYSGYRYL